MVDRIQIHKIVNGYVVTDNWYKIDEEHSIHFKDMETLVKHLDECFVKPYKDIGKKELSTS